jgi:hypothetical protein
VGFREKAVFVPIRKLEADERMGLIAIFNRGVSIRKAVTGDEWRVMSNLEGEKGGGG